MSSFIILLLERAVSVGIVRVVGIKSILFLLQNASVSMNI